MNKIINPCKRCGMTHESQTEKVMIKKEALKEIGPLLNGKKKALIISDGNTRPLGVEEIIKALKKQGIKSEEAFFDTKEIIIPDEKAIEFIVERGKNSPDVMIVVGAGVLNDLCKYVSYLKKTPYMIVATAPSMDGYASKGAALILEGMKVTENAHVPTWIVADTKTLALSPMEMIQAGIGDII